MYRWLAKSALLGDSRFGPHLFMWLCACLAIHSSQYSLPASRGSTRSSRLNSLGRAMVSHGLGAREAATWLIKTYIVLLADDERTLDSIKATLKWLPASELEDVQHSCYDLSRGMCRTIRSRILCSWTSHPSRQVDHTTHYQTRQTLPHKTDQNRRGYHPTEASGYGHELPSTQCQQVDPPSEVRHNTTTKTPGRLIGSGQCL